MPAGHHARFAIGGSAVVQVTEALDAFCAAERLPQDVAWRLRVALDEIIGNIVAHAGASLVDVWFHRDDLMVEVTVADDGRPFDPLSRPEPVVTLPLALRQPGGLGIALVKALMDDVRYERTSDNVLTMRKRMVAG
jgi:serine/threonine-protein kinase RsbW